jgi:hypothetical protein
MQSQRPLRPYQYKQQNTNNDNWFVGLFSVGISIYIAYINTKNLEYNRQNAVASQNIAKGLEEVNRELDTLNKSDLVYKIHNHTEKGNNNEQTQ